MAKKTKVPQKRNSSRLRNQLFAIPALAFVVKLGIIARIQGFDWFVAGNGDMATGLKILLDNNFAPSHVWYGADAENYLRAVTGLFRDGFFSNENNLYYWPAGYPILIWMIGLVTQGSMLVTLAVLQSLLYAFACIFFVDEIRRSRLVNFSWPLALALSFNPTLALNTYAIGYELPCISLILIATAALMRNFRTQSRGFFAKDILIASACFSLATFMQPRFILLGFFFMLVWLAAKFPVKTALLSLSLSLLVVSVAPAVMIFRNKEAVGFSAISTNLGTTMNIGAGYKSTGGYTNKATGVECPEIKGTPAQVDSARVKCVLNWYLSNPGQSLRLFWNKSIFFWSPWYGPISDGTTARNPWRLNHPLNETVKTKSGYEMVFGTTGKLISWLWMLLSLLVLLYGAWFLWRAGGFEKVLGLSAFGVTTLNWLTSILTIGDHRFRMPTMGLSITLQVIGLAAIFMNRRKRLVGSSTPVSWPSLSWKQRSETDSLWP